MPDLRIIGGKSLKGMITLESERFRATAYSDGDNRISCRVVEKSAVMQLLAKHKYFPIPRIARLMVFIFADLPAKIILPALLLPFLLYYLLYDPDPKTVQGDPHFIWSILAYANYAFIAYMFWEINKKIAPWHGAEHMAISGYEESQSDDLGIISRQDTVHPKCGGRLLLPLLASSFAPYLYTAGGDTSYIWLYLLAVEITLWIDAIWGWDRVFGFSQASVLLQRYVTTSRPGQQELLTAQAALRALIAAHSDANR